MKKDAYRCPKTSGKLNYVADKKCFINEKGDEYPIVNGIPDFTYPSLLSEAQQQQHEYYQTNAVNYDDIQNLAFAMQNVNEHDARKDMLRDLRLKGNERVLELCCGTGRDSEHIAELLKKDGELFVQDLSSSMLEVCRKRLSKFSIPIDYSIGNAAFLSFPDNYFDAVYSFGGLNVFDDIAKSLQEMVRVTKPGGRIIVGDESLPVWLYKTEFGKMLLNGNPMFKFKVPYESIPVEARDVSVRWVIGGVFYLIAFTVGEGEPVGNFDLEIPGARGGTLRTRYYGQLEGVSAETKMLVEKAAEKSAMSKHKWLDENLKSLAKKQIEE